MVKTIKKKHTKRRNILKQIRCSSNDNTVKFNSQRWPQLWAEYDKSNVININNGQFSLLGNSIDYFKFQLLLCDCFCVVVGYSNNNQPRKLHTSFALWLVARIVLSTQIRSIWIWYCCRWRAIRLSWVVRVYISSA